ncbi:hypothetical protein BDEG_24245 [Batrachochytrium dendrobatidis JEL423]|uniref:Uncharacterized protein n=1 Tax=Batrachochytrium dendrobatidis (strain JEL423) TaxID=403673 RepID=A0A177WLH5_BATDL|nr:hypothetical protein BDEG_24245 [Batrachochytrium dendrobatidis JEL423]
MATQKKEQSLAAFVQELQAQNPSKPRSPTYPPFQHSTSQQSHQALYGQLQNCTQVMNQHQGYPFQQQHQYHNQSTRPAPSHHHSYDRPYSPPLSLCVSSRSEPKLDCDTDGHVLHVQHASEQNTSQQSLLHLYAGNGNSGMQDLKNLKDQHALSFESHSIAQPMPSQPLNFNPSSHGYHPYQHSSHQRPKQQQIQDSFVDLHDLKQHQERTQPSYQQSEQLKRPLSSVIPSAYDSNGTSPNTVKATLTKAEDRLAHKRRMNAGEI